MLSLSPSKISTYRECPRKFRFLYIDRLGPKFRKARPFLTLGNNVHAALRDFFSLPLRRRKPHTLQALLEERWATNRVGFRDEAEEEFYKARALGQLHQFARNFDLEARPLMLERRVNRRVAGVVLQGIVDRVDREGDAAHVMDYKTGAAQGDLGPFSLYFYALTLQRRRFPPVEKLSYVFLESGVVKSWWYDHAEAMQTVSRVLETAYEIAEDDAYSPRPGRGCRYCDFLEICPEGRRVVNARAMR